jgi:GAF domain-containing protein
MLRSVAQLLAVEIGEYCVLDVVDTRGAMRRIDIQHADPSRRARLRAECDDVARHHAPLTDVEGARVRASVSAAVTTSGATRAMLSLVATSGARRYDHDDRATLTAVAEWTSLGLENALLRAHTHQASVRNAPTRRRSTRS